MVLKQSMEQAIAGMTATELELLIAQARGRQMALRKAKVKDLREKIAELAWKEGYRVSEIFPELRGEESEEPEPPMSRYEKSAEVKRIRSCLTPEAKARRHSLWFDPGTTGQAGRGRKSRAER